MPHDGSRPDLVATIMTEDAKTEKNTAGAPAVHTYNLTHKDIF